jgi:hypothetical protein
MTLDGTLEIVPSELKMGDREFVVKHGGIDDAEFEYF